MIIEDLLEEVLSIGASDLHLSVGQPPVFRIDGELIKTKYEPIAEKEMETLLFPMLSNEQRRILEQTWELDFSYGIHGIGRFRVNLYKESGCYAAAFRTINVNPPTISSLGLPDVIRECCELPRGLILVTGPTGSGKTTTLAAMVDYINSTFSQHILTIEDPVEFVHKSKKSLIHQRELGLDTRSFANALRAALREDPDVILVGELRDLDSIQLAITAAETGHLVLGTLHTSSAAQTIDRVVDVFPEGQQQQIRIQLSNALKAVFAQTLLPKLANEATGEKKGRVLAQEIMLVNSAISNLIREGKTAQIYSTIQTNIKIGMRTLEMSLADLYKNGTVTYDDALSRSSRQDELKRLMKSTSYNSMTPI